MFEEFVRAPMPFKPIGISLLSIFISWIEEGTFYIFLSVDGGLVDDPFLPEEPLDLLKKGAWNKVSYFLQINMYQCVPEILYHLKILYQCSVPRKK